MAPLAVLVRLLEDGSLHQDMSSLFLLLDVFLHQAITGPILQESGDMCLSDGVKFLLPSWVRLVSKLGTVRIWQGFQRHLLAAAADEHRRGCLLRMLSGMLLFRACERERARILIECKCECKC
jgi:hypothetical protein